MPGRASSVLIYVEKIMEWTTPQLEEISLNCEINSYASPEM